MAKEGMRFNNAYLSISSCSPSRCSIISGRYPHNTGAAELHTTLPTDQPVFPEALQAAGYYTALSGKHHMGKAVNRGFDKVSGGKGPSKSADWVPMLRERPKDKPFFFWFASSDAHRGWKLNDKAPQYKPEDVEVPPYLYDGPVTRKDLAEYMHEVSRTDYYVGQLRKELKEQGIEKDTYIIYMTDNGRPFPRDKTTLYDSGIKTPFIVHWPGRIDAGSRCNRLVSSVDIAPTFLELAGLSTPKVFEGRSFLLLLRNPKQNIRDFVFAERNWHDYEDRVRAVRNRRFKYIRNFYNDLPNTPPADVVRSVAYREMIRLRKEDRLVDAQKNTFMQHRAREQLYDVQADPFELKNLAADPAQAKRLKRFRRTLAKWQQETGDTEPRFRTLDEFSREDGQALPVRERPRPDKAEMTRRLEAYYRKQAK